MHSNFKTLSLRTLLQEWLKRLSSKKRAASNLVAGTKHDHREYSALNVQII